MNLTKRMNLEGSLDFRPELHCPLPFLLSSLLQSRAQLKVSNEEVEEDIDSDEDLDLF